MTGDGWADVIARPTMHGRPWSFILFVSFYSLFAFVLLNIFTGIMVDAIQVNFVLNLILCSRMKQRDRER